MSGQNNSMLSSASRMGAAAELLLADVLARSETTDFYRQYGDERLDAATPTSLVSSGPVGYDRPDVDVMNDLHIEDPEATVDGVITAEDVGDTTWFSTGLETGWAPTSMRVPLYRYETSPTVVPPYDYEGDDDGLSGDSYPAWMSGETVSAGDSRTFTIFGVSANMISIWSPSRVTISMSVAELNNWDLSSQASIPAFLASTLVPEKFKILDGADTWKSNSTRITGGTFDAAEKLLWTQI